MVNGKRSAVDEVDVKRLKWPCLMHQAELFDRHKASVPTVQCLLKRPTRRDAPARYDVAQRRASAATKSERGAASQSCHSSTCGAGDAGVNDDTSSVVPKPVS